MEHSKGQGQFGDKTVRTWKQDCWRWVERVSDARRGRYVEESEVETGLTEARVLQEMDGRSVLSRRE